MLAQIFSEKIVLVLVTVIGMALCTVGIGQVAANREWLHPMAILGYLLGALILGIVGTALLNLKLPLIDSTRAALMAVLVLAVVKVVLTQLHHALA